MRLPDGSILMHGGTPYDPVKAHDYYMRTRKLKGRKSGSDQHIVPKTSWDSNRNLLGKTFSVRLANGATVRLTSKELNEQKAYVAKRINKIKSRLRELNSELRKMMVEAKAKQAKSERKAERGPTAAEKSKAARESKQYREKHRQSLATKARRSESKTDPVTELEDRISLIEENLIAAVARQRSLMAATRTVDRPRSKPKVSIQNGS